MMVGAHLYGKQMYAIGHSDGYQQGSTDTQRIYEETQPEQAKQEVTQWTKFDFDDQEAAPRGGLFFSNNFVDNSVLFSGGGG